MVSAPCDDPSSPVGKVDLGPIRDGSPIAPPAWHTSDGAVGVSFGAAKAFDVTLVAGQSYCAHLTACTVATEALSRRCVSAASSAVTLDTEPPIATASKPMFNASGGTLPLLMWVSCDDSTSGVAQAISIQA